MNLQPKTNSQLGFISLLGVVVVVVLGVVSIGAYQVVSGKDSITWLSARFQNDMGTRLPRLADGVEQLKRDLVLGEDDRVWTLTIAVPSQFKEDITAEKSLYIDGDLDVAGVLRASNLISAILGGAGISVTGDSTVTVINTDPGSAQTIFKTIKVTGGSDIVSSSNEDTLTFEAGDNISLTSDTDNNKITISAEGQEVDYTKSGWKQVDDFLFLTDSGDKVGIGTETPSSKFHVVGNSTFSGIMNLSGVTTPLVIASNSNNTAGLKFVNLTSSSPVGVGGGKVLSVDSAGNVILVTDESGAVDLDDALPPGAQTGATLYFDGTTWGHTTNLFHDGGKVGISTNNPDGRLHVFTNDASTIGLTIQGDASQTANLLEWKDSDGNLLSFIDENGVYNGTFVGDLQGNVTGTVTPTGFTAGSVAFAGTGGVLSQDNSNLFWDDSANRLGIGTNSPSVLLDLGDGTANESIRVRSVGSSNLLLTGSYIGNPTSLSISSGGSNPTLSSSGNNSLVIRNGHGGLLVQNLSGTTAFYTATHGGNSYFLTNLGVGTTNIGSKLVVMGTGNTSSTSALNVINSDEASLLYVRNDGNVGIGTVNPETKFELNDGSLTKLNFDARATSLSSNPLLSLKYNSNEVIGMYAHDGSGLNNWGRGTLFKSSYRGFTFAPGTTGDFRIMGISGATPASTDPVNFIVENSGNVGIGTSDPQAKLDVAGNVRLSNDSRLRWRNGTDTADVDVMYMNANNSLFINAGPGGASQGALSLTGNNDTRLSATSGNLYLKSAGETRFTTSNEATVRMVIDADGNVGIGTNDPSQALDVVGVGKFSTAVETSYLRGSGQNIVQISSTGLSSVVGKTHNGFVFTGTGNPGYEIPLVAKAYNGQTANLQEWQNSSGTPLASIGATGQLKLGNTGTTFDTDYDGLQLGYDAASNTVVAYAHRTGNWNLFNVQGNFTVSGTNNIFQANHSNGVVINEQGTSHLDMRVEGDTDANLFFTDASTDRVGIGTNSPGAKLTLSGTAGTTLRLEDTTNSRFWDMDTSSGNLRLALDSRENEGWSLTPGGLTSIANTFFVTSVHSRVGIGTNNPSSKLHLTGSYAGNALAMLNETGSNDIFTASASGTTRFVIQNNGDVGIGTNNPVDSLDIAGGNIAVDNSAGLIVRGVLGQAKIGFRSEVPYISSRGGIEMVLDTNNDDPQSTSFSIFNTSTSSDVLFRVQKNANVGIGTTSFGTDAAKVLALGNGTAPSTSIADGVQLWAEDEAASSELKVRDEAGNITTLSPHNFSLIGAPSEPLAWSYYSKRGNLAINADMTKALRLVEALSGEKLIHIEDLVTGEEINSRYKVQEISYNNSRIIEMDQELQTIKTEIDGLKVNQSEGGNNLSSGFESFISSLQRAVRVINEKFTIITDAVFEKSAEFLAVVTFKDRVVYEDRDRAGFAVIKSGDDNVRVEFEKAYEHKPVINLTAESSSKYWIENADTTGFTIKVATKAESDVTIHWTALAITNPVTVESTGKGEVAGAESEEKSEETEEEESVEPATEASGAGSLE